MSIQEHTRKETCKRRALTCKHSIHNIRRYYIKPQTWDTLLCKIFTRRVAENVQPGNGTHYWEYYCVGCSYYKDEGDKQ